MECSFSLHATRDCLQSGRLLLWACSIWQRLLDLLLARLAADLNSCMPQASLPILEVSVAESMQVWNKHLPTKLPYLKPDRDFHAQGHVGLHCARFALDGYAQSLACAPCQILCWLVSAMACSLLAFLECCRKMSTGWTGREPLCS